jgi:hypothetical protein
MMVRCCIKSTENIDGAVHCRHKIAVGDYNFAAEEISKAQNSSGIHNPDPDDVHANRFLAAFYEMAEGLHKREQLLVDKVQGLVIKFVGSRRHESCCLAGRHVILQEAAR